MSEYANHLAARDHAFELASQASRQRARVLALSARAARTPAGDTTPPRRKPLLALVTSRFLRSRTHRHMVAD